jgi:hypothetical protein
LTIPRADESNERFRRQIDERSRQRAHTWAALTRVTPFVVLGAIGAIAVAAVLLSHAITASPGVIGLLAVTVCAQLGFAVVVWLVVEAVPTLAVLSPIGCEGERHLRSLDADQPTNIRFENESASTIEVFWLNYDGIRDSRGSIGPGGNLRQRTWTSHPFLIVADQRICVAIFKPAETPCRAIITQEMVRQAVHAAENRQDGPSISEASGSATA